MARKRKAQTIRGEVVLPADALPEGRAHLIVQVEDVSRADAPATMVGEHRQTDVLLPKGGTLPFAVEVPDRLIDEHHSYSVRAHLDMSGSGEVKKGDLVSTQSHPVLTRGYGTTARIPVKRV